MKQKHFPEQVINLPLNGELAGASCLTSEWKDDGTQQSA